MYRKKSVSDYVLYVVTYSTKRKVVLMEGKSDKMLSKSTVSQLIGYYIASEVTDGDIPPLGLILTQSKARFVFFPYKSRTQVYVDAIVTEIIDLHKNDFFAAVLSFITRYILCLEPVKTLKSSDEPLHKKEVLKKCVISHKDFMQTKEQKLKAAVKVLEEKEELHRAEKEELQAALAEKEELHRAELAEKEAIIARARARHHHPKGQNCDCVKNFFSSAQIFCLITQKAKIVIVSKTSSVQHRFFA